MIGYRQLGRKEEEKEEEVGVLGKDEEVGGEV